MGSIKAQFNLCFSDKMAVRTIEFQTYRFKEPPFISEHDYNRLKQGLQSNNDFYPFPEDGFVDKLKHI